MNVVTNVEKYLNAIQFQNLTPLLSIDGTLYLLIAYIRSHQ